MTTPSKRIEIVLAALRENDGRHLYEGSDGLWWVSIEAPNVSLTRGEVDALEAQGLIRLDFPGFYKLQTQYGKY